MSAPLAARASGFVRWLRSCCTFAHLVGLLVLAANVAPAPFHQPPALVSIGLLAYALGRKAWDDFVGKGSWSLAQTAAQTLTRSETLVDHTTRTILERRDPVAGIDPSRPEPDPSQGVAP